MTKRIDVAIAILRRGGQILICRRGGGGTFPGAWEFPGGKCEPGEAPETTVIREAAEELGVHIRIDAVLPFIEHDYAEFSVRLHPFLCSLTDGEPRALAAESLLWVEPHRLGDFPFPAANAALIELVQRAL